MYSMYVQYIIVVIIWTAVNAERVLLLSSREATNDKGGREGEEK